MNATNEPIFRLPEFTVHKLFTAKSEVTDWSISDYLVPPIWSETRGENVKVAILDTGIARNHPDLKDAIVETADFMRSASGVSDRVGHGTHVAGTVAARRNNTGCVGVAPAAKLYIAKVLGDEGYGTIEAIENGIAWAIEKKVHIVSLSLGAPQGSARLEAIINEAVRAGIIILAAAGNEGPGLNTIGYPAMYPGCISVASVGRNRQVSRFSSRGGKLDIAAPGENITSCYPENGLATMSGTSMATPFVTGVVSLLIGYALTRSSPTPLNEKSIRNILRNTATDAGRPGVDTDYGFGIVNPTAALAATKKLFESPVTPPPPVDPVPTDPAKRTVFTIADFTVSGLAKLAAGLQATDQKCDCQQAGIVSARGILSTALTSGCRGPIGSRGGPSLAGPPGSSGC